MSQFSWPTNSPKPLNISALPHYTLHQRLFVLAFAMGNESLQMDHSPKHEQIGGYFLVDAKDVSEAIAIASRIPGARIGTVEVRPVTEVEGLPDT